MLQSIDNIVPDFEVADDIYDTTEEVSTERQPYEAEEAQKSAGSTQVS